MVGFHDIIGTACVGREIAPFVELSRLCKGLAEWIPRLHADAQDAHNPHFWAGRFIAHPQTRNEPFQARLKEPFGTG